MSRLSKSLAASAFVAFGFVGTLAHAQQQGQGQPSAVGTAAVRTREGAPTIQLDQHQSPVITVVYGQQQSDAKITGFLTYPEQPQQDKEILFNRESAQQRIVAHEGNAGQVRRLTLVAQRGQENAQLEPLAQNEWVIVYGVRRAEPKVAQQPPQQPQQPAQPEAQQAAAQQDPAQAAKQAEEQRKRAEDEAKRKAAEPKPDKYDAIITVFLTTGR